MAAHGVDHLPDVEARAEEGRPPTQGAVPERDLRELVAPNALGEASDYLVENATAIISMYQGEIVSVEIPASVELRIAETEPGIQGDRVSGARKPATLETGKVIQVPLFVNVGERVKVDTRTGEYITRV